MFNACFINEMGVRRMEKLFEWMAKGILESERYVAGWGLPFLLGVLAAVGVFAPLYFFLVRKRLEKMCELNLQYPDYRKRFDDTLAQKDEGMRRFFHDMAKHLGVVGAMCERQDYEQVRDYIRELQASLVALRVHYTGNTIVDYFLNEAAGEMEKAGKKYVCDVCGEFPEGIGLSDTELCVLFGNAIENAKEELLRCEGELHLRMMIQNYNGRLYVEICNTCRGGRDGAMRTKKDKKEMHGYGMGNMERVVRKYGGRIKWEYKESMFGLKIEI